MAHVTYREYCILFNDKDAENTESNRVSVQTIEKHVRLCTQNTRVDTKNCVSLLNGTQLKFYPNCFDIGTLDEAVT